LAALQVGDDRPNRSEPDALGQNANGPVSGVNLPHILSTWQGRTALKHELRAGGPELLNLHGTIEKVPLNPGAQLR